MTCTKSNPILKGVLDKPNKSGHGTVLHCFPVACVRRDVLMSRGLCSVASDSSRNATYQCVQVGGGAGSVRACHTKAFRPTSTGNSRKGVRWLVHVSGTTLLPLRHSTGE